MASWWCIRKCTVQDLPHKIQGQTIKNVGNSIIYVCNTKEDLPIGPSHLLPRSKIVVLPGQEVDLVNDPNIDYSTFSFPDRDVTLHSDNEINVEIIGSDLCDRWMNDPKHPWNGAPLSNFLYTNKYNSPIVAASGNVSSSQGSIGTITLPSTFPSTPLGFFAADDEWHIAIDYSEKKDVSKCTCGVASLKGGGKHSSWCDLQTENKI